MIQTKLLELISEKRKEMINLGLKCGLTHHETIKYSHELDDLINMYQRDKYKKYKTHYFISPDKSDTMYSILGRKLILIK